MTQWNSPVHTPGSAVVPSRLSPSVLRPHAGGLGETPALHDRKEALRWGKPEIVN
jgi:hypothetical protein